VFTAFQLLRSLAARITARLIGLETPPPVPHYDERKAGAAAARSSSEDGTALASAPRLVIRGERTLTDRLALLRVRDGA